MSLFLQKIKDMASLQTTAFTQYEVYTDALANKSYRDVELAQQITVRGAMMTALYNNAAMANDSANMAICLAELEVIYAASITPPPLIISGLETEATSEQHVAVTGGISNPITFPISLSTASYALFITSYTADGTFNSYKMSGKTVSGFAIEVADDGFIDYRAIIV